MICIVLAAGYATRLYPITENFPKPLLSVKDKAILDWLLDDINNTDKISEYIIVTNNKYYSDFLRWKESKNMSITVLNDNTVSNESRLGAVKDIQYAIDQSDISDDVLIIAGDNLLDFSMKRFIEYYYLKKSSCVMRYYEQFPDKLRKGGVVEIDKDDKIINMEEKPLMPKSNWLVPPFYILTAKDISRVSEAIENGCKTDAPGSLIVWLQSITNVYAMKMPGKRYDIGDIVSYEKVQREYGGIND